MQGVSQRSSSLSHWVTFLPGCDSKISAKKVGNDPYVALTDACKATCEVFQKKFPSFASLGKILNADSHSTETAFEASDTVGMPLDGARIRDAGSSKLSIGLFGWASTDVSYSE